MLNPVQLAYEDASGNTIVVSAANPLPSSLSTADIEIGAVEIKDGAADIRQTVLAASTAAAATDKAAVVALHPSSTAMNAGAASAITTRVVAATDSPEVTKLTGPTTGTVTSVNDTNVEGTILAANASRKGATFWNDSTVVLYLILANSAASATSYTAQLAAGAYYELPVCQGGVYTGIVRGVWASDASGAVRVTELT